MDGSLLSLLPPPLVVTCGSKSTSVNRLVRVVLKSRFSQVKIRALRRRVDIRFRSKDKEVVGGDVQGAMYGGVVANGVTQIAWTGVQSQKVRLVFTPTVGERVRLVEFKVF